MRARTRVPLHAPQPEWTSCQNNTHIVTRVGTCTMNTPCSKSLRHQRNPRNLLCVSGLIHRLLLLTLGLSVARISLAQTQRTRLLCMIFYPKSRVELEHRYGNLILLVLGCSLRGIG
jgi:hypothetical protein